MRMETRIATGILILVWLVTIALTLSAPRNHDEHMYLGAASQLGEHRLYAEFAFPQTPYSVWIYAGILKLAPGNWTLLPARLLQILVSACIILASYRLARRLGAGVVTATLLPVLLYHDEIWRITAPLARNYDFAQLAILGALLLLPLQATDSSGRVRWALAGALAGVAIGFKLSYAPLSLVIVASPLILGHGLRWLPWVLAGAVAGIVPMLLALLGVDPTVVWFNLVDYHLLNARFNELREVAGRLDARQWVRRTDHAVLVAMALATLVTVRRRDWGPNGKLVLAVLLASMLMAFGPKPTQAAYGAPLVLALLLIPLVGLEGRQGWRRRGLQVMVALGGLVMLGHHMGANGRAFSRLLEPHRWTPVMVHQKGLELARCLGQDQGQPMASTQALPVLEAGRTLSPEWVSYPFIWRLDGLMDPVMVQRVRAVSPSTLATTMAEVSPSAILVGKRPWDGPLREWAMTQGRMRIPLGQSVEVWLPRPD